MSSPVSGGNEYFSSNSYYSKPIRHFFDRFEKKDLYYTITDCIFEILAQETFDLERKFDMERKKVEYLVTAKKIHEAKITNCRNPWEETAELKKDKEFKRAFETEVFELIKGILGEKGVKEVMKLQLKPRIKFAPKKNYLCIQEDKYYPTL